MQNELFCQPKLCVYVGKDATKINQVLVGISLINCSDEKHLPKC